MLIIAIITVPLTLVATYFTYRQLKKKKLSYAILVDTHPIKVSHGAAKNIKMTYKGNEVQNVRLVEMKIWNSGNAQIELDDYIEPITLLPLAVSSKCLDSIITKREPDNLAITIERLQNHPVILTCTLLNQGDAVYISLLLSDYDHPIIPIARISGVKEITKDYPSVKSKLTARISLSLVFLVLIWLAYYLMIQLLSLIIDPLAMDFGSLIKLFAFAFLLLIDLSILYALIELFVLEKLRKSRGFFVHIYQSEKDLQ